MSDPLIAELMSARERLSQYFNSNGTDSVYPDLLGQAIERIKSDGRSLSQLRNNMEICASYKADAARYRWLRDKSEPSKCALYMSVGAAFKDVKFTRLTVDAAIDDAIAEEFPEGMNAAAPKDSP